MRLYIDSNSPSGHKLKNRLKGQEKGGYQIFVLTYIGFWLNRLNIKNEKNRKKRKTRKKRKNGAFVYKGYRRLSECSPSDKMISEWYSS
ncbi:hypothetical protein ES708_07466 [subsurface metagenome]